MAEVYKLTPGELDIEAVVGDEFGETLTWNIDLDGYTFDASVGDLAITVTVVSTDPDDGSVLNLSLTEAETLLLGPGQSPWRLRWIAPGDIKRTVLAGTFKRTRR